MNTVWFDDLIALSQHLNFSKAAEARNVTQPAFSRRIKSLEDAFGTDLIDRSSHRLKMTEAGDLVLTAAKEISSRIRRTHHEVEQAKTAESSLTFASTHALSFHFFPNWFKVLPSPAATTPVYLLADNMRACERMMSEGRAQFLLCHTHPMAEIFLPDQSYLLAELATDSLVPVSKAKEDGAPLFSLEAAVNTDVPYLSFDDQSGMGRILRAALGARIDSLNLKRAFASHLSVVLKALSAEGKGIAWAPYSLVKDDLESRVLALAGPSEWTVPVSVALLRPRARQSALAEQFWALATSKLQRALNTA